MRNRYKIFFSFLAIVLTMYFASFASSEVQTFNTVGQNECVTIIQTCGNCTYANLTAFVIDNSTFIFNPPVMMTKTGTFYNTTFCNTTAVGNYIFNGDGNPNGVITPWNYDLKVTANGFDLSIEQAIFYLFMLLVSILLFVFFMVFAIKTPWKNGTNTYGYVIEINSKKYIKLFSIVFAYLTLLWIVYTSWALSTGYLQVAAVGALFNVAFVLMSNGILLMIPLVVGIGIYAIWNDLIAKEFIKKWGKDVQ